MPHLTPLAFVLLVGALPIARSNPPPQQTPRAAPRTALVLAGARVLDPTGARWLDGRAVLIVGEQIERIAPEAELAAPAGAQRVDLAGMFLVPGLIDLHTHLLLHPYDEARWDDQVLRESLELRTVRATAAARVTLLAGFTTIRELGTEGAGFADVALRDAIAGGIVPGPRIFATTRAIVASGCYGPSGFDPRWSVPKGAQEADGTAGVRQAVREQVAAGADWIKVYADYRRTAGDAATPTFSQEELDALVDEAKSAGRRVAAHATTDEGVRRAVLAGVATIEHGYNASAETLALMRERGTILCPTLSASEAVARYSGWKPGSPPPPSVAASRELIARARAALVKIACGTDAGVFAHGENAHELELLVECGLTSEEALRSATTTAAKVLGRERDLGRIAPGFVADLVAVREDPLARAAALRSPAMVFSRGVAVGGK